MIPTPHKVTIEKASGELDIWGDPIDVEPIELQANIRTKTDVVKNSHGEEVVVSYRILFIGIVDVKVIDKIKFVEANGETVEANPVTVKFIRDLSGEVKFTKVVF